MKKPPKIPLENILADLPGYVFWKDKNLKFLGCNDNLLRLAGVKSKKDIIGKNDDHFGWGKREIAIFKKNDLEILKTGTSKLNIQEFINSKDGKKRLMLVSKSPLHDDHGKIVGIIGIASDITDYKTEGQIFLENIIALMPGFIFWKNKDSVYLGCNDTLATELGLKNRSEIVGMTDFDTPWRSKAERFMKDDSEVIAEGKGAPKLNIEESLPRPDGSFLRLLTNKVPLYDSKGIATGILAISHDITPLKKAEQEALLAKELAEAANKAKSNFLAVMSHELRTPLNAILGMTQLLNAKDMPDEYKDYIKIIQISGVNLLALINDILDFSKLEAGKIQIKSETFNLKTLMEETIISLQHLTQEKQIKLALKYDQKIPNEIKGDAVRLRQILINLANNAIKFTEKGQVIISVKYDKIDTNHLTLSFIVKDTGIGIPKDKLEYIFERFTQVNSNYSRRFGGAGLGLSISKQLTEAMGGKIKVKSTLGKGSEFHVTLPFFVPGLLNNHKLNKPVSRKISSKTFPSSHILLVEDNKINQYVARIMLEEIGCKVDIADNGKQAFEFFQQNAYGLVLMDIGLPDMDGIEVTKIFRHYEHEKKASKTPIIAITAHALEEDRHKFLQEGMDDIIVKPVMKDQLTELLKKWIRQKNKYHI